MQNRKDELIQTLWDLFKDVHGVRPRGIDYDLSLIHI